MCIEDLKLSDWGQLHQVWFVRDYYTLVFEDSQKLHVYNPSSISNRAATQSGFGQQGFSDTLIGCIDDRIEIAQYQKGKELLIRFIGGTELVIHLDKNPDSIPEAFEAQQGNVEEWYVEFNT